MKSLVVVLCLVCLGFCSSEKKEDDTATNLLLLSALTIRNPGAAVLTYTTHGTTYVQNTAIQQNTAVVTNGTVTGSYTVSPSLPAGLSLDATTGAITGTPTGTQASTQYIVNVIVAGGNTQRSMTIGVNASAANVTCNTVGTAPGCTVSFPFSCTNSAICSNSYAGCRAQSACNYYL